MRGRPNISRPHLKTHTEHLLNCAWEAMFSDANECSQLAADRWFATAENT